MSNSGKQSPLGINLLGSLLASTGLSVNPVAARYMGSSKTNSSYTPGKLVTDTLLRLLTFAINDGYRRGPGSSNQTLSDITYNNLISIGANTIPALGNSKPATYVAGGASDQWTIAGTPATTGYSISGNLDQGQAASWLPYTTANPNRSITQWGYIRLHALQAWNEFNWNGDSPTQVTPSFSSFCGSFMSASGFANYTNQAIMSAHNATTFLDGVYSNMNDFTSADITGVSLSTKDFGKDLINLGKAFSFADIDSFGLPSNLLKLIASQNAISQDLSLALLASGLSSSEIAELVSGNSSLLSEEQELNIYGAFLVITGENLQEILAPLQCKTRGLDRLADLLNVKKMFPNSYQSLTVPKYNGVLGLPTNSKTYYLIYQEGTVNAALSSTSMQSYVGTLVPSGKTVTSNTTLSPENYALPPEGFDSYLRGIIPPDQAIAAGALSFSLRQINNIQNVDFKSFAKAVQGIETMSDLDLINGTSKPTNQTAIDECLNGLAIGSGPYGTLTMSDMFGSMSGLPYAWKLIYKRIKELENRKLITIYQQLYLATTWEQATATVEYTTGPGPTYTVTGVTISDPGGGYGRGGAPVPVITISDGTTATLTIGTDDDNPGATGDYGRVKSVILGTIAAPSSTIPTATIEAPPIDVLAVDNAGNAATDGVNYPYGTVGWPSPMNAVVQAYIDQANSEIQAVLTTSQLVANHLNAYWNTLGSQLAIEQRTRYNAIPPVSLLAVDNFTNPMMSTLTTFIDSVPEFAQDTLPHMTAQTLEAISDMSTLGGQSSIAMMRQERNTRRLNRCGIQDDNSIPDQLSDSEQKTLLTNGTLKAGRNNSINGFTNPAWPINVVNDAEIVPVPNGIYIPDEFALVGIYIPATGQTEGDITPLLNDAENPVVGSLIPVGPTSETPDINSIVIIEPPDQIDLSSLPAKLGPDYISSALMPSSPSVATAVNDVTTCNCDCWIE